MTLERDPYAPPPLPAPPRRRVTTQVPADPVGRTADGVVSLVLSILGTLWVLAPPYLFVTSLLDPWNLYGEPASDAQLADAHRHLLASCALAVTLPVAGFLLALAGHRRLRRRPAALRFFAVTGVLAGIVTGLLPFGTVGEQVQPAPASVPRPVVCQEHSGGGNECPGG